MLKKHHAMLKESEVDEIFKQSNVEYEDDDANPDDQLNRIELMEFYMRLAVAQRKDFMLNAQKTKNFQRKEETWQTNDQLKVLLTDYILPYSKKSMNAIMEFRDYSVVSNREVSILLEANFRGLNLLYHQYMTKGFDKNFSIESLREMLVESRLNLKFDDKKLHLIFGASKMTVVNEAKESAQYFKLEMVEF